jgi:hypothetical protein
MADDSRPTCLDPCILCKNRAVATFMTPKAAT